MNSLKIIFMGTPDFSVPMLDILNKSHHEVIGVVTVSDKPAGRGQKIKTSAIKDYAIKNNLLTLQPENLKDPEFINELKKLNADLFVVIAFRMLPEVVWGMPKKGTINLHASLLPQYRGAAPINWAIINGEKESGVTTFFIEKEIDTGKIIEQLKVEIGANTNVGELYSQLIELGEKIIGSTVDNISENNIVAIDQKTILDGEIKNAPKIFKKDCIIDWNDTKQNIHNKIRGLSPYPGAKSFLYNKNKEREMMFKLLKSEIDDITFSEKPSITSSKKGIYIKCKDGYICISALQMEGKKAMNHNEFLAGNNLTDWSIQTP